MLWGGLFPCPANTGQCPCILSSSWGRHLQRCRVTCRLDKTKCITSSGQEFPRLPGGWRKKLTVLKPEHPRWSHRKFRNRGSPSSYPELRPSCAFIAMYLPVTECGLSWGGGTSLGRAHCLQLESALHLGTFSLQNVWSHSRWKIKAQCKKGAVCPEPQRPLQELKKGNSFGRNMLNLVLDILHLGWWQDN